MPATRSFFRSSQWGCDNPSRMKRNGPGDKMIQFTRRHGTLFGACVLAIVGVVTCGACYVTAEEHAEALSPEARARIKKYEQAALTQRGHVQQGKTLFADAKLKCNSCHRVGKTGGQVGPHLSSIGGKFDRPHLIESLLEPSRQIVEGYRSSTFAMKDGKVITGVVRKQNDRTLTVGNAEGKLVEVVVDEIELRRDNPVSLMPTGLTDHLTPAQFADLIAYLESLRFGMAGKPGAGTGGPIALPKRFRVETVLTGITGATALETLPDGRILICDQTGSVRVVENGKLLKQPFVTLPVDHSWERGVIGVTIDPNFPVKPYVYVCWVAKSPYPHHRISRFEAAGNIAKPGSEQVLLKGDDQTKLGGNRKDGHQGGAMHFGHDGCLYIAIGEQTAGKPAQNLDTFLGKMLRINPDGSIPDDNPLIEKTTGKYQAIWAYGMRNPYTFAFDRSTGQMLINDVGGKFEEVNPGIAGRNYGWPVADHGPNPPQPFVGPIHWYPQASIAGGDFVPRDSNWPADMKGKYLFADFNHGWIKSIDPANGKQSQEFASGLRRPVDMRFDHQGNLYVLLRNAWVIDRKFQTGTGSLLRIQHQ